MSLDLSKASGPYCISVVALKNCEPEISYILAELFNKCLLSVVSKVFEKLVNNRIVNQLQK